MDKSNYDDQNNPQKQNVNAGSLGKITSIVQKNQSNNNLNVSQQMINGQDCLNIQDQRDLDDEYDEDNSDSDSYSEQQISGDLYNKNLYHQYKQEQKQDKLKSKRKYDRLKSRIQNKLTIFSKNQQLNKNNIFLNYLWKSTKTKIKETKDSKFTPDDQWIREIIKNCEKKFRQKLIVQQIIKQLKDFILKYQNKTRIFVQHNTLKIEILTEQKILSQSVLHVYKFQDTVRRYMANFAKSIDDLKYSLIEIQIAQIFIGLFKCLKCLLIRATQQNTNKGLEQIDFLLIPSQFQHKNYPICIGGLRYTCLKFYQTLIKMILQRKKQIATQIQQQLKNNNRNQIFKFIQKDFQEWIQTKLKKIKQSQLDSLLQFQNATKRLNDQVMKNFYYQVQNVTPQKLYNSINSIKIQLLSYVTFNKLNGKEQIIQNNQNQVTGVKLSGKFIPKKVRISKFNKKAQTKRKIDFNLAINTQLNFKTRLNVDSKYNNYNNFLSDNIFYGKGQLHDAHLILFDNGEFHLFCSKQKHIETFKKSMKQMSKVHLQKIIINKKQYCYDGKFGDNLTKKINCDKNFVNTLKMKLLIDFKKQVEQQIKMRIDQLRQTYFNIKKSYPDYSYRQEYKQQMRLVYVESKTKTFIQQQKKMHFYINKNGYFKVTGVWDLNKLEQILKDIQNKITSQNQHERKMFQSISTDCNENNIQILSGKQNQSQYLKQLSNRNKFNHKFNLTQAKLFYQNKQINHDSKFLKTQSKINKLKILIWNVKGSDSYDFKNPKNRPPFQKLKYLKQRIRNIIQEIIHHEADFICLQETQILLDERYDDNDQYYQKMFEKLRSKYYYAILPVQDQFTKGRSLILSKTPVNFYVLNYKLGYQNTVCDFKLNINGELYKALLISIHLKATSKKQYPQNHTRWQQLDNLQQICKDFQIVILAGDFNIGDNDQQYQQKRHKFFEQFIDLDEFLQSQQKPFTIYNQYYQINRFDRIMIRFKGKAQKNEDLLLARPRQLGNYTSKPYQNMYYKIIQQKKRHSLITLSDHFGRCTEITFKKQNKNRAALTDQTQRKQTPFKQNNRMNSESDNQGEQFFNQMQKFQNNKRNYVNNSK